MTMFVETEWRGEHIPVAEISGIGSPRKGKYGSDERVVTMRDGARHTISDSTLHRIIMRPVHIVPAEAGTFHLSAWRAKGKIIVHRTPVVGWAVCADGEVRPVTPHGVFDLGGPDAETYVLMPDGKVNGVGEHTEPKWFSSLADYVDHVLPPLPAPSGSKSGDEA